MSDTLKISVVKPKGRHHRFNTAQRSEIARELSKQGVTAAAIAKRLGTTPALICRIAAEHKIKLSRGAPKGTIRSRYTVKIPVEDRWHLLKDYRSGRLTAIDIANTYHCSRTAVNNMLKRQRAYEKKELMECPPDPEQTDSSALSARS